MSKELREKLARMTTADYIARIMELQQAVEWRDAKLAEQERVIGRLRELLAEERAKHSSDGTSTDSPQRSSTNR